MPQVNQFLNFRNAVTRALQPANLDQTGAQLVGKGLTVTFNVTAATVIKNSFGRVAKISVITAGSTAGSVNDAATTGAAAVGNQLAAIPNAVSVIDLDMPFANGLVVTPGTGQVLAVSFQ
jgi:hypothetical protein